LLAVEAYKADLGPHGFSMQDATNPANQFAYVADSPPLMDWAAQTISVAQEQFYKANPDGPRGGHLWSARKRPT
jgi:hypothetical protein